MPPDEFVVQFSFRVAELPKSMTFATICPQPIFSVPFPIMLSAPLGM